MEKVCFYCLLEFPLILGSRLLFTLLLFFFSSRRRHTRLTCDWSSDVCSSDLPGTQFVFLDRNSVYSRAVVASQVADAQRVPAASQNAVPPGEERIACPNLIPGVPPQRHFALGQRKHDSLKRPGNSYDSRVHVRRSRLAPIILSLGFTIHRVAHGALRFMA